MVVSTPPSTADAISGDDMESDMSLESRIEGSIKRCEDLLSMLPMTLGKSFNPGALHETSNKKLRKARVYLNMNMKNLMEGLEPEWNKNMGLLSNISMSRDISSSPASSWQSYSLHNEISTQSYNTDNDEAEMTRFRTSKDDSGTHHRRQNNKNRYAGGTHRSTFQETWPEKINSARGTSGSSEECQSSNPSEDVSNRATSDSGESAESAVTDSLSKEVNLEKQSMSSLKSELEKLCERDVIIQDTTSASLVPAELGNGREFLEEKSLGGNLANEKRSPLPREITISLPKLSQQAAECGLGKRAEAMAEEQPDKHSSCSSSVSEPTVVEPKKFTSQTNKNAAELKPTGLPTNYRKVDALPQKEWNSSLKFVESKCKLKGKLSRQEKATVVRLSTPKILAAQRVCHVKTSPEVKRNETPLKESVMRLPTPKVITVQKVCHVQNSRTSSDSKTTPERSSKPRVGKKTEAGSKCFSPFVERLGDMQERINSTRRAKKIREKEERDLCSFRPNINSTRFFDVEGYQPIEKRLNCIREQKDKMITKARDQEAKHLGITFRPELNPNSVRILKEV